MPRPPSPRRSALQLIALCSLAACNPWNLPDNGYTTLSQPTWDPAVVVATDGVYVRLPYAGALLRVTETGDYTTVDLAGERPESLVLAPDDASVLVKTSYPVCTDDDPKIKRVSDCDYDDLDTVYSMRLVRDGAVVNEDASLAIPEQFNKITFNEDGSLAVAYLDFGVAEDIEVDGVLNLTEVTFLDLDTGESHNVPVGFAAESVLFTPGAPRAVVLSRSQVAVVDLATWAVTVTYPLTLDPDSQVVPTDVVLTPDGRYALVSVSNQSDLYVLDLEQESIDLVELSGVPSDLLVDSLNDRTLIVYAASRQIDVLEHGYFELESFQLDEPSTDLLYAGGRSVLYNQGSSYHDVYTFDPSTGDVVEYRAENPVIDMYLSADYRYAVATLNQEGGGGSDVGGFYDQYYGLSVFNLDSDRAPIALALEARPVGVAIVGDTDPTALVLLEGVSTIQNIHLADAANTQVELSVPPTGIYSSPQGTFVITQASPAGQMTFLDPTSETLIEVAGFATSGLLTDDTLPHRNEE